MGDMFYVTTLGHSTFKLGKEEGSSGETISYTVTVISTANGNKYFIDGEQQKALTFEVGNTYEFDLSAVPGSHPFLLSTAADGRHGGGSPYTEGVTTVGNKLVIEVTESTPNLSYYCDNHPGMGASASVISSSTGPVSQVLSDD